MDKAKREDQMIYIFWVQKIVKDDIHVACVH